jgi:hypothetical protein
MQRSRRGAERPGYRSMLTPDKTICSWTWLPFGAAGALAPPARDRDKSVAYNTCMSRLFTCVIFRQKRETAHNSLARVTAAPFTVATALRCHLVFGYQVHFSVASGKKSPPCARVPQANRRLMIRQAWGLRVSPSCCWLILLSACPACLGAPAALPCRCPFRSPAQFGRVAT